MSGARLDARARVLVADDHNLIVRILQRSLQDAGYDAVAEMDGDRVVETVQRERPEVAIVDANMAPGGRFDALRALCALNGDVRPPIIVISGEDDPAVRDRALRLGARAFLLKPWNPDELLELVEGLVAERRRR